MILSLLLFCWISLRNNAKFPPDNIEWYSRKVKNGRQQVKYIELQQISSQTFLEKNMP